MGKRIFAHYQILEKLGEGGMGVVWKARDPRLNRVVALKLLPPALAQNEVRRARFIQEARAASALNHPNIITIYDIGFEEECDYIAMEFVDGCPLADLVAKGRMKIGDVLRYSVQIADALAAAHRVGIVHRDLKPMNIMVTPAGLVKVLDFGIAKLTESEPVSPEEATIAASPHTADGTILGTIAYMSPEQAQARKVDSRSDIFTFGSILYEMIAGRQAFTGDNRVSVLSAIVNTNPKPVTELIPVGLRELDRIIRRCLRKDPASRYQHMDDLKISLQDLKEDSESGSSQAIESSPARPHRLRWIVIGAAIALAAASGTWIFSRRESPTVAQQPLVRQLTFDSGLTTEPTFWPSGNMIAYASDRATGNNLDIWVQQIGGEARQLTHDAADDYQPDFAPDGTKIAFRSERAGGGIFIVPTLGGTAHQLTSVGYDPRFSPDGKWISYWVGDLSRQFGLGKTFIIPAEGGEPRQIAPHFLGVTRAVWSPDSKRILFTSVVPEGRFDAKLFVQQIAGGDPVAVSLMEGSVPDFRNNNPFAWVGNEILYSAAAGDAVNVWSVQINPVTLQARGNPKRLTAGTATESHPVLAGRRLIYSSVVQNNDLFFVPIDPATAKASGDAVRLTQDLASDIGCSVSEDGNRFAWFSLRSREAQLMVLDLRTGQRSHLTTIPLGSPIAADISADGERVSYTLTKTSAVGEGFIIPFTGGTPEKVCDSCVVRSWADRARSGLLISRGALPLAPDQGIYRLDLEKRKDRKIWSQSAPARALPDGKWWVGYSPQIDDNNKGPRLYIVPIRQEGPTPESALIPITMGPTGDYLNAPSPDGSKIFFMSSRDGFHCLWAQKLNPSTKRSEGDPFPVFHQHSARRSTAFVGGGRRRIAAARNKVVFTVGERTGNIWFAELPDTPKE